MAYTPTTWVNGSTPAINAANLNNMETGIADAHDRLDLVPRIIVAADDSSDAWKAAAGATYTCDGTADDVQINAAIAAAAATAGTSQSSGGAACEVLLAPGTYVTDDPIDVYSRVKLHGVSRGGVVIQPSSSHSAVGSATSGVITISDPLTYPYDHCEVSSLSIHGNGGGTGIRDLNGIYSLYDQSAAGKDADNLGGSPDHHNILRDLAIVSCGRSGVYLTFTQASTGWKVDHVKVFGCGDTLSTAPGIYMNGLDGWISNCDVGSQGDGTVTTNPGFTIAGSNTSVMGCFSWLNRGPGFLITGANLSFANCQAHHCESYGFKVTNNRCDFSSCISYNNNDTGFYLSANSIGMSACHSYDYSDSYGHTQGGGIEIDSWNPIGHMIQLNTYGQSGFEPIINTKGTSTSGHLARKANSYRINHTGTNADGTGTPQWIEWKFGCFYGYGTGSPEGVVTAPPGSQYTDYTDTSGTVYRKDSGTGNTGWVAL